MNFVTNILKDEYHILQHCVAIKAAEIRDYTFTQTAKDAAGNILPGYIALYFGDKVTEKQWKLYMHAYLYAHKQIQKGEYV